MNKTWQHQKIYFEPMICIWLILTARLIYLKARPDIYVPRARIEFRARPVSARYIMQARPGPTRRKQFPRNYLKLLNTMVNLIKHLFTFKSTQLKVIKISNLI